MREGRLEFALTRIVARSRYWDNIRRGAQGKDKVLACSPRERRRGLGNEDVPSRTENDANERCEGDEGCLGYKNIDFFRSISALVGQEVVVMMLRKAVYG